MSGEYGRAANVLWRNAGDRVLLRSLDHGGVVSLEGSGTMLWELLAEPISFDAIVAAMSRHYAIDPEVVREPVATALDDLKRANLVTFNEHGAAAGETPPVSLTAVQLPAQQAAEGTGHGKPAGPSRAGVSPRARAAEAAQ